MGDTARALAWIVHTPRQHQIPFQAVGGLAARAYGATRPIIDLDFYIAMERFDDLRTSVAPFIRWGPQYYRDNSWDITFVKLEYAEQKIELGGVTNAMFFNRQANQWVAQVIDFHRSVLIEVLGTVVPVMPKAELIAYKRMLDRPVDQADIAEMEAHEKRVL
jgi:hypothetical protein